jgi:hypothetical protein
MADADAVAALQAQVAQMQQLMQQQGQQLAQAQQAAIAAQQAAQNAAQQQQPPQAAAGPILMSPWDGDIDLGTKVGTSLWNRGIEPCETKFSGDVKDLPQFLASFGNQADMCRKWAALLMVNNKYIPTHYGEIKESDAIAAKDARAAAAAPATVADAQERIHTKMMYHYVWNSLGAAPQKKLAPKRASLGEDGPLLLYYVLSGTFAATHTSTFAIKEKFFELHLKKYKWNVQLLNQDVREKLVDLIAAGHASDETETLIALFRAYKTATNEEFLASVNFWKNEWNSSTITTAEQLMDRADKKYSELRDLGSWSKRSAKDEQIVALTSKIEALTKQGGGKPNDKKRAKRGKKGNATPEWKKDKSLSTTNKYTHDGKEYQWCTGPGHNGVGMWVRHSPGKCVVQHANVAAKSNKSGGSTSSESQTGLNKAALTSMLKQKGLSQDEVDSKIEAIVAVMDS